MPLGRCSQVLLLSAAQFVRITVEAIKNAISLAKDLLVEGYEIVVNLIEAFPRTVFWLGLTAVVLSWVF